MSAAWFGLAGVVVGGFISTVWAWLAIVRAEQTDAMVAARLIDDDLAAQGRNHELWLENRASLAKVLGEKEWRTVAKPYSLPADEFADHDAVVQARNRLRPLVAGKRHVIPARWRKKLPTAE